MSRQFMRLSLIAIFLAFPACTTGYYMDYTDQEVDGILSRKHTDVLGDRYLMVRYPEIKTPAATEASPEAALGAETGESSGDPTATGIEGDAFEGDAFEGDALEGETFQSVSVKGDFIRDDTTGGNAAQRETIEGGAAKVDAGERPDLVRKIALKDALDIAFQTNRQYISEKESLYFSVLSLINSRHTFSPQLSAVLSYLYSDGSGVERDQQTGMGLGLSQNLPYGGSVSLNADTSFLDSGDLSFSDRRAFSSSLGVSLSQPLLRGAGREVAMNSLIQAERNLVYDIRSFELFRQGFSIDVARRYYDLVRQDQSIGNERTNLESFVFARRQADAFYKVGRTNELDKLRARRSELNSRNRLIEAEEGYLLALDQFKIFLGLPTTAQIEIVPDEPEFQETHFDTDSAVEVAMMNRLDLMTRKEQVEDSARSLRIAENGMLPDLDLNLGYNLSGDSDPSFSNQRLDNRSYSAGVSLELPFDRVSERTALRRSQISYERTLRAFQEYKDNLVIEIHSAFRELKRRHQSLDIQRKIIEDEEKNAKIADIRFKRGEISNRDLVEAKNSLLDAKNSLINEKVDYEITRLELLMDLGILFIDEKGMWYE